MQSRTVDAKTRRRHRAFVESQQFAGELARIPLKWRGRVVSQALELMSVWHWNKIFEPVAVQFVREFAEQYVPAGVDLSQDDADICATAEKAAENVKEVLWKAISDTRAGVKQTKYEMQAAFLREIGIPFISNARGRPVVLLSAVESRRTAEPPKKGWKPAVIGA